jgi:hypothetical protein
MLNAIKQAALDALEASSPVTILFGTVTKINPLEVNVDQRFTIDADFLIIPESLMLLRGSDERFEMSIKGNVQTGPVVDDESQEQWTGDMRIYGAQMLATRKDMPNGPFTVGDKLILLRVQGGQKYVVLDRVWEG